MRATGSNAVRTITAAVVSAGALLSLIFGSLAWTAEIDEIPIGELIPKVFLAYGGKEAFAQLDRNYSWLGQQKLTTAEGSSVAEFRQIRKHHALRIDVEPGGDAAPIVTVFDGTSAWKATGKIVTELDAVQAQSLAHERDHEPSVLTHFGEDPYFFKLLGRTNYRGAPVFAVEMTKPNEPPVTIFVDQKNYLVDGVAWKGADPATGQSADMSVDFLEYRPQGGTMVPHKQIHYVNEKPFLELELASVDLTKEVNANQFHRPDKPYEMRLTKPVAIPFEYTHKEILVKVKLNDGEPLDFLFDTAASQTVIDRRTAAEHFLDKQGSFNITGAGGAIASQMTQVRKLELGNVEMNDVQAIMLDLTSQTRQIGKHVAGIIGSNVLSKFAVTIDFSKSQIILHDASTFKAPANANFVSFREKTGPIVKAIINGGSEVNFLVDTGAAFNNIPTKVAKAINPAPPTSTTEATGVDGSPVRLANLTVSSIKLGNQMVKGVPFTYQVDEPRPGSKGFIQASSNGVLGNPFWQNFIITLDYRFQRLFLQPNTVVTAKQEIDQLLTEGDKKLNIYRDLRAAEAAYQKALLKVGTTGDPKLQAKIWGRMGNLRRIMAKDLNRPEQARIAYEYFSKAQQLAHKMEDRETEGRILGDWSLLYVDNGQVQQARQALDGALLFAPQDPQVNLSYAVYWYKLQNFPQMQRYVDKALFLEQSNWQALWYKLKIAEMFGDNNLSKETLKEILKYYPWSKVAKDKYTALTQPLQPLDGQTPSATDNTAVSVPTPTP